MLSPPLVDVFLRFFFCDFSERVAVFVFIGFATTTLPIVLPVKVPTFGSLDDMRTEVVFWADALC